jgi:putative ABC transport system ATP-binding protein
MTPKLQMPNPDPHAFIHLEAVTKIYQQGKIRVQALNDLNFVIDRGEFVVIFGPSGSGKTTLLNLIGGLDRVSSGAIQIGGLPIHELAPDQLDAYRLGYVGFIFQGLNLYPSLTVRENVFHQGQLVSEEPEGALLERVDALLDVLGMGERRDHLPDALSGGEQQRAAIGMALIKNPAIIIADEPTGELDAANTANIINLFGEVKAQFPQTTFLVVSHNYAWQDIADRVLYLENGQIKRRVGITARDAPPSTDEFPDIPPLLRVLQCPWCNSYNVQLIIRRPNELQVGAKHAVINGIIMCNDCAANNPVSAKVLKEGEGD